MLNFLSFTKQGVELHLKQSAIRLDLSPHFRSENGAHRSSGELSFTSPSWADISARGSQTLKFCLKTKTRRPEKEDAKKNFQGDFVVGEMAWRGL
jgi:hypothetical protein